MKLILAILTGCMLLTACGIKGDLYLPPPTKAPTESVSEIEADPLTPPSQK